MTLTERRAAVRAALLADPCRSDRIIAAEVGVYREMVSRARHQLIGERLIEDIPVKATDGKLYRYRRTVPVTHAQYAIARISRTISVVTGPKFAETWHRTTPDTRQRIVDELERLGRPWPACGSG
jgi:hypothetical protein